MNLLQRCQILLFPSITRSKALAIATASLAHVVEAQQLVCHCSKPEGVGLYLTTSESCWYVLAPWGDGCDGKVLRQDRVIVIGKMTGTIHFDG